MINIWVPILIVNSLILSSLTLLYVFLYKNKRKESKIFKMLIIIFLITNIISLIGLIIYMLFYR